MDAFVSEKTGRTFVMKLVQGEDLLKSIQDLISKEDIDHNITLLDGAIGTALPYVRYLGGCCGTGPDYIRALKEMI